MGANDSPVENRIGIAAPYFVRLHDPMIKSTIFPVTAKRSPEVSNPEPEQVLFFFKYTQ